MGSRYAGWNADAAANDFVDKLVEAGRRYAARTGGGEATIPIILDGENAWEHFEGGGRPFLRSLYGTAVGPPRAADRDDAGGVPASRPAELDGIFPGSWIDANFYIWIGHRDDQLAWSQLAEARAAVETPSGDAAAAARAREEVLIAEGSDWFWWYGDDHSSEHDLEFDDLFRRHLRNVYRLLGKTDPRRALRQQHLRRRAAATRASACRAAGARSWTAKRRATSSGSARASLEVRDAAGAMHQSRAARRRS